MFLISTVNSRSSRNAESKKLSEIAFKAENISLGYALKPKLVNMQA